VISTKGVFPTKSKSVGIGVANDIVWIYYDIFAQKVAKMEALQIENTDKYLRITVDKEAFGEIPILDLLEYLRTEDLIRRAQFDESIVDLSKKIKKKWWADHKEQLLK